MSKEKIVINHYLLTHTVALLVMDMIPIGISIELQKWLRFSLLVCSQLLEIPFLVYRIARECSPLGRRRIL